MRWPLDPMTLMWIQVATGAFGTLTLVFLFRSLLRRWGKLQNVEVYFSPKGGCQAVIVREMMKARREILVQAYSFTADPLTYALVEAKKQGVIVDLVLDKSNEIDRYSDLKIFLDQEIEVRIDHEHAIAHNKIIIIDQKVVITGSYNFTNQAEESNAENVVVIKGNPDLARAYRDNFFKHREHAKPAQLREADQRDRRQPQAKAA